MSQNEDIRVCQGKAKDEMDELLATTRLVNRTMQGRREGETPDYSKLAKALGTFSTANAYLIGCDGRVLGYSWQEGYSSKVLETSFRQGIMPELLVERVNHQRETVVSHADAYLFDDAAQNPSEKTALFVPIYGGAERLGTLILSRLGAEFSTKDLVLAEYLATIVGLEILHDRGRQIEEEGRERLIVQMAMRALSYSEVQSIRHIIEELDGFEGVVVASRVADRVGVTRSVIVNAFRKLESAGIIESRSLGMKGTHLRILSPLFVSELGVSFDGR